MQDASKDLLDLPQVGVDIFYRGLNHGAKFKYKIQNFKICS